MKKISGGGGETRPKNSTIKPFFTLSVPCIWYENPGGA